VSSANLTSLRALLEGRGIDDGIVVIKTEPHVLQRYSFLRGIPATVVDLTGYAGARSWRARQRAARSVVAHLESLAHGRLASAHTVVCDVTEGWFGTTLFFALTRVFPDALIVGTQHGVMELTGPESRMLVRRLRALAARLQWRLFGVNVIGAGFGNNPFAVYGCYGERYAAYVRRLHPGLETIIDFPGLSMLEDEYRASDSAYDIVFLGQDLTAYGVRDSAGLHTAVFRRLEAIASRHRLRVLIRLHPKQTLEPAAARAFPNLTFDNRGPIGAVLSPKQRAVISFNSTGLIEAAYIGCPIVALRVAGLSEKWYEPFVNPVPLDHFVRHWELDVLSSVRADEIGPIRRAASLAASGELALAGRSAIEENHAAD